MIAISTSPPPKTPSVTREKAYSSEYGPNTGGNVGNSVACSRRRWIVLSCTSPMPSLRRHTSSADAAPRVCTTSRNGKNLRVPTSSITSTVSVLLNSGHGALFSKTDYGAPGNPSSLAIGDVTGDHRPDLVVTNASWNTVSVLVNRGTTTAIAVSNFEATASDAHVQLRWRLTAEAASELRGLLVQRAQAAKGPYRDCGGMQFELATEMSFEDVGLESASYWYRLVLLSRDGSRTLVGPLAVQVGSDMPATTALHPPIEPSAGGPIQLRYSLARAGMLVRLAIYDVTGRLVWSNERRVREAGEQTQTWDRRDRSGILATRGIYLVRLNVGGVTDSRKLLVLHR